MKNPECVGPYTLLSPLGDDARGRVWLAGMGDGPNRLVLKLAREGNPAVRTRLLHEVDILGALDHYNIVRLYECGESKGILWMATGYVAGPHLPLTLAHFRQLLLALVHVHANGVVHADVKPANLLLDEEGDLRLAGFGNARRVGAGPMGPGGMPQFMAPEQLRGESLDARADLFSAGAVLYRILTGKRPFDGTASPGESKMPAHALALPSALVPGLGTSFDKLIVKVLANDKAERHDSAFALLGDFDVASHHGVHTSV